MFTGLVQDIGSVESAMASVAANASIDVGWPRSTGRKAAFAPERRSASASVTRSPSTASASPRPRPTSAASPPRR